MEKGLVFPHDRFQIKDHLIIPGFAAIRNDNVHENTMIMELEVQPDDLTRTLHDA